MKIMFLDIETIPAKKEAHEKLSYLHAKKAQKQDKNKAKDFEQVLVETSFDGSFGRILCIGYTINDEPTEALYENDNEKLMLEKFWDIAKDCDLFVGHNIFDFDMMFIYQRSIVLGVKPTRDLSFARYRSSPMFDTMKEWVKWAPRSIGLEHLALALDFPSPKDGIDGSQVWDFYKKGKIAGIVEYCKRDVETTRSIFKKMNFKNTVV